MESTDTRGAARRRHARPGDPRPGPRRHASQARSPGHGPQPRHVRGRGRGRADDGAAAARPGHSAASISGFTLQIVLWLWITVLFANLAEAVAEGRGKAQAATLRRARTETTAKRLRGAARIGTTSLPPPQGRRPGAGGDQRPDPQRRRGDRGHRLGRRVRDHRRVRPGDPRKRRRPLGRDRRHPRAVGPDHGADHRCPGLDLHRPHDRPGGGRHAGRRRRTRSRSTSCWSG